MERSTQQVRDINQQFWRDARLPQLQVRSTFGSVQGYKAHSHSELSLGLVLQGATCLTLGVKTSDQKGMEKVRVNQDDLVLIEPGQVHACNPIDGQARSYHMLYVDGDWCRAQLEALYGIPVESFRCDQRLLQQSALNAQIIQLVEALHEGNLEQARQQFEALMFEVLSAYCSPLEAENARLDTLSQQLRQRVLRSLAEPPSLQTLAAELSCSQETLIRRFRQDFAITPKAFIHNARIARSKVLLGQGMEIAEVAAELGFADQSQFHKAFVNYTASTPRQYQQALTVFDNTP